MSDGDPYHNDLIKQLGGKAKLALALSLEPVVLTQWHARGIPSKYWHRVVLFAASLDPPVVVSATDLERTKPGTAKAAA